MRPKNPYLKDKHRHHTICLHVLDRLQKHAVESKCVVFSNVVLRLRNRMIDKPHASPNWHWSQVFNESTTRKEREALEVIIDSFHRTIKFCEIFVNVTIGLLVVAVGAIIYSVL